MGWPVTLLRTPKALTYGAAPGCHTPTMTPGIEVWRMTCLIAVVSADARLGLAAAAGPAAATSTRVAATSTAAATNRTTKEASATWPRPGAGVRLTRKGARR